MEVPELGPLSTVKFIDGNQRGMDMKYRKVLIIVFLVLALLVVFCYHEYDAFCHKGLDQALIGQVEGDTYPDWDSWNSSEEISSMECEILSKKSLRLSQVYLIRRANHYQMRLRIAFSIPFMHPNLLEDMDWSLEDSAGNSYTGNIVVYKEQIAGLNCLNVTLILDEEEFSNLSGTELYFGAYCFEKENNYAHCEAKIPFP